MAGETINVKSAAWHTVQAATSTNDGAVCGGTVTSIQDTALSATEEKYPLLDFQVKVSAVAPVANTTVDIYRRPAGDVQAPIPAANYTHEYVGSAVCDDATGSYYVLGVRNADEAATYYMLNRTGNTVTLELLVQTRGWSTA
jgi:hypothetical protein